MTNDVEYLRCAYRVAGLSNDRSTRNGAVLYSPRTGRIVASACNDIPSRLTDTDARRTAPAKFLWTRHAEMGSILAAAKHGMQTEGLWMYCPWAACEHCAIGIIEAGISRLITHVVDRADHWEDRTRIGLQMLDEAGVTVSRIDARMNVKALFNGMEMSV